MNLKALRYRKLLEDERIKEAKISSVVDYRMLISMRSDEEVAHRMKVECSRSLAQLAGEIMTEADWRMMQSPEGLIIQAYIFVIPQRRLFDLLDGAYKMGLHDSGSKMEVKP